MLYLISLGLSKEDISIRAIETAKQCGILYFESYTSVYPNSLEELQNIFKKDIIGCKREVLENNSLKIIEESKKGDIGILVIGDCLSATTHISLILEARKNNVEVKLIHSVSVLNVVAETGLSLYNFGRVSSLPFSNENVISIIENIKINRKNNMHSLILLDLDPDNEIFVSINDALFYLEKNGFKEKDKVIACCQLGFNSDIKYGSIKELKKIKFDKFPQCLIIPSKKLHFVEEEYLNNFKV
ncbi:MAG TPA: diphthine synthase [Candidatus Nanoarchaeia archaeon]|nr:diphthine synthase [Candidatus Nanoarchaeia archaeon]